MNTATPGAGIKPTGVTGGAFDAWSADRRAPDVDPVLLGPAAASARDGLGQTAARLAELAETEERAEP